jgi:monoamine oxidase
MSRRPPSVQGSRPRVCVIGAGFAGLAAADELARAGVEVVVCEARTRVGGRVASATLGNGSVIELGAEFILPDYDELRRQAARFGLPLADKGMAYGNREPRGVDLAPGALDAARHRLGEALAALPDGVPIDAVRFLASLDIDPAARETILARAEISCAAAGSEIDARALGHVAALADDPCPTIAGGNDRLAFALAGALPSPPILGEPVRAVELTEAGAVVRTETLTIEVEGVVVAVPAPLVGEIEFTPGLGQGIAAELDGVVTGHAAKLFVELGERPRPSAVMSVPDRYWTWTARGADGRVQPVVSAFAGSTGALGRLDLEAGPGRWLQSMARLRPELSLELASARLQTWSDDPWSRLAYSASAPRAGTAALEEGFPRLAFCGEHLGGEHVGLMEGALRTGPAAARRLLRELATGR